MSCELYVASSGSDYSCCWHANQNDLYLKTLSPLLLLLVLQPHTTQSTDSSRNRSLKISCFQEIVLRYGGEDRGNFARLSLNFPKAEVGTYSYIYVYICVPHTVCVQTNTPRAGQAVATLSYIH
jgi:hypothetical protein